MILCETELNHKQVKAFSQRIDEDYTLHMLADNLPAATVFKNLKSGELQYEDGFKLGFSYTSHVVINNHLKIRIKYHAVPKTRLWKRQAGSWSMETCSDLRPTPPSSRPASDLASRSSS
ncbi:Transmembrane 9 superfamily member 7 [Geodia barretti]|nr:Transmembrane 9 superfamily member 7 [Geodia barretti]